MFIKIEKDIWINTDHISKMELVRCHDGSYNLFLTEVAKRKHKQSFSFPTESEARTAVRNIQEAT